jgi:hypothetical protein
VPSERSERYTPNKLTRTETDERREALQQKEARDKERLAEIARKKEEEREEKKRKNEEKTRKLTEMKKKQQEEIEAKAREMDQKAREIEQKAREAEERKIKESKIKQQQIQQMITTSSTLLGSAQKKNTAYLHTSHLPQQSSKPTMTTSGSENSIKQVSSSALTGGGINHTKLNHHELQNAFTKIQLFNKQQHVLSTANKQMTATSSTMAKNNDKYHVSDSEDDDEPEVVYQKPKQPIQQQQKQPLGNHNQNYKPAQPPVNNHGSKMETTYVVDNDDSLVVNPTSSKKVLGQQNQNAATYTNYPVSLT